MTIAHFIAAAVLLIQGAAGGYFDGGRGWGTEPGQASLVYGKAVSIRRVDDNLLHELVFEPHATLAGNFDPTQDGTVKLHFSYSHNGNVPTAVKHLPADGSSVLLVMLFQRSGRTLVHYNLAPFMPGDSSMVVVEGLGDPVVSGVVEEVRRRRQDG